MTAYLLTNHLLNFMAPAAFVALAVVLLARIFSRFFKAKKPLINRLWVQAAIIFAVNVAILTVGLLFFGRDGKMASYALLALGAATGEWVLLRGWKV